MDKDALLEELLDHYHTGSDEVEKRKTRKNGWDDVLKAYFGQLPANWPYTSKVVDPVIRTAIIEKVARQFNNKLKGRVTSRKGEAVLSAKLMNALLDYQWDNAEEGGTMLEKWALMDIQTRLFGASFGLCHWRVDMEDDKVVFEGNDFKVLDNRDVFVDYSSNHVKNANWVQVREFVTIEDLEERNDMAGELVYTNLDKLITLMGKKGDLNSDARDVLYTSLVKEQRSLEDMVGRDKAFPVVELVTEYRCDRWFTFAPRYNLMLRNTENPYKSKKIPIVQLRYYPTGDDAYGDSEIEAVLPIQRAINSFLSGYIDQMNIAMRPPVKIANPSEVRVDTIVYGPNALWIVGNNPNNVTEHQFSPGTTNDFQAIYQTLKSAFNTAMGEMSMGVSNMNVSTKDKTATEVRAIQSQSQSRDQYNQMFLAEALKDQMQFWITNNQQYIFEDPKKTFYLFRIVGRDMIRELMETGMNEMEMDTQIMNEIANQLIEAGGMEDTIVRSLAEASKIPAYPVIINPNAEPNRQEVRSKMETPEGNDHADIYLVPEDLEGSYSYIPDVVSMSVGAVEQQRQGMQEAMGMMLNPQIGQKMMQEGYNIKLKEVLIRVLENNGVKDAEKYFEKLEAQPGMGGALGPGAQLGMGVPQGMDAGNAQPGVPGPGGGSGPTNLPAALQQGMGDVGGGAANNILR